MKSSITLKEFNALSFDGVQIIQANGPGIPELSPQPTPESVSDFHAQQNGSGETIAYRHWGLND